MVLRKRYSFLFIPEGNGRSREVRIPRWSVLAAGGALLVLLVSAGLYLVDWAAGAAWRPGGSALAVENERLRETIDRFETRTASLQQELDRVFKYQQLIARTVDVEPLDAQARAGGIGGRTPLTLAGDLPGHSAALDLETLLRQARIQQRGMTALLDTLAARQEVH